MSDRVSSPLSLQDKDALMFQNRSQAFPKDVTTFAIDPLGKIAVLCGKRGLFFVKLDEEKLDIYRTVRDPRNAGKDISGVRWSRNPNILASTCLQELSLWDLNSSQQTPLLSRVSCHRRAITGFDWSNHQENVLATASFDADSLVYLWDLRDMANPVRFHALRSPFGGASAVKWSRREEHLLAASHGTQLLVWDVRKESAPIVVIPADLKPLVDFDWSYREDLQVLTCAPGSVKFWNLSSPKKAIGSLQTSVVRARYSPFSKSCVTLTGQADRSWDLWNLADIATPFHVREYGIEDYPTVKTLGALSKFNWRRVLVGSSFEYQLITWSTKDQMLSMWRIGAEELEACGAEPSKLNKLWSAKLPDTISFTGAGSASPSTAYNPLSLSSEFKSFDLSPSGSRVDLMGGSEGSPSLDWPSVAANAATSSAPGSGKLWDGASVDSSDSESAQSSYSTASSSSNTTYTSSFTSAVSTPPGLASGSSRSRANSNTLMPNNGSSSVADLTSPPGSFKLPTSSPGSKRLPTGAPSSSTGGHQPTRTTLPRPVSYDVELDILMKHPMVGLTLEKHIPSQRMVLFSLRRGKTHVEMRITFPTMYPHGAPPSFTVLTNTSVTSTVKTKEILVDTAQDYVSMNRNCLAPAFSQLIEYLGTQDSEVLEAASIEANSKESEAALTRQNRRPSLTLSGPLGSLAASQPHLSVPQGSSGLTSPRHHHSLSASSSEFTEYVVKPTDSLPAIALFFNMTVGELRKLNKIQHSVQLLPGQMLLVKRPSLVPPSPLLGLNAQSAHASPTTPHHAPPVHASTTIGFNPMRPHAHSIARTTLPHPDPHVSLASSSSSSTSSPVSTGSRPNVISDWVDRSPPAPSHLHAHHAALRTIHHSGPSKSPPHHHNTPPIPGASHSPPVHHEKAMHERTRSDTPRTGTTDAIPARRAGLGAASDDFLVSPSPLVSSGSFMGSPIMGSERSGSGLKSRAKLFEGAPVAKEDAGVHVMRCKFVDRTTNPPQLIEGLLTATPSNLFFEPDLDQPPVLALGALHYSIFLEMKKVREAADLKSMNLSLAAVDESAYLQILTKDRQTINQSKIILFMAQTQAKVEEISQAMTRWISASSEKRLVDGLGLDINPNTQLVGSFAGGIGASDLAMRANRHVAGDIIGNRTASTLRDSSASIRSSGALAFGGPVVLGSGASGGPTTGAGLPQPSRTPPAASGGANDSIFGRFFAGIPSTSATKAQDAAKHLGPPPNRPAPSATPKSPSKHKPAPKQAPVEDPDDLPSLLGNGQLLSLEIVWTLRMHVPQRFKYHDWKLAFSTAVHGTSLLTFYKQLENKSPTILVIRDTDGHLFGGFASEPWAISKGFFGTGESFLFSILPTFAVYTWTGADDYYLLAKREFLAMGGGGTSGRYGLWLDSELSAGTSEVSKTFLNRRLSLTEEFKCASVEVYSLVPK